MGRILLVVLALAVLGGIAWKVMYGSAPVSAGADGPSQPKQQLDNVRKAATRIEADQQKAADDVAQKAFGNE
ncbi:MAG: hypothetical protein JNJ54_16995 [Myxococcaceae bacterium]|nr:hypothetical protein [Myxococcaceae bacterium]